MIFITIILAIIIIAIFLIMQNTNTVITGDNEHNREEIMNLLGYNDDDIKYVNIHKQMFIGRHRLKTGKKINDIIITKEGAYSFTSPKYMDEIIKEARKFLKGDINTASDITANIGASALTLDDYYNTTAYEIDELTYKVMIHNLSLFENNITCINDSFFNHIDEINNTDLVFYDPPWGGPEYKENDIYDIILNDHGLGDIVNIITTNIIMKLPINADISFIETMDRRYKKFYTTKKGRKKWLNIIIHKQ